MKIKHKIIAELLKLLFYNKSIKKMLECIDKLDKQSERLDEVESHLNIIKRRLL